MAHKHRLTRLLVLIALFAAGLTLWQGWQVYQVLQFNQALAANELAQAAAHASPAGQLARARLLASQGQSQEAAVLYGELQAAADPRIRAVATFNLGNLYLTQALAVDLKTARDLAVPLLELAKESYRSRLREDSGDWEAKYNLERALALLPDPKEQPLTDWQAPERSQRSVLVEDSELQGLP